MKIFDVKADYENMRLDRYLLKQARFLSKPQIEKMIRKADVKLNGKKTHASDRLAEGDKVTVYSISENNTMYKADMSFPKPEVLYEDDYILAVNKPPYLPSQSVRKGEDSLNERIRAYLYEAASEYGGAFIPGIANRLDTNTSGIVLCGKTPACAAELSKTIRENALDKHYYVLVRGSFDKKVKYVSYGKKDSDKNIMLISDEPCEGYVKMISVFAPIKSVGEFTLLEAKLITGRTHQIRAQLAYMGNPVAGDNKYGSAVINRELEKTCGLKRQFLHAYKVGFKLPTDGSLMSITCPLYTDLADALDKLSKHAAS